MQSAIDEHRSPKSGDEGTITGTGAMNGAPTMEDERGIADISLRI